MLTLYGDALWVSPWVLTSFVGLREKGLAFETRAVSLGGKEQLRPEYRDASLTARVPALDHDGYWLSESIAIVEYLAEWFPFPAHPRIFPADLRERGRCRQLMGWLRTDLAALREERPTSTLFYERARTPLSEAGRAAAAKLARVASSVLADGATQLFDAWCIADADLALALGRLILNGDAIEPRLRAYFDAQWARPSVREFAERARPPFEPY
ncbi:MAG TPA: glutathione transferase [Polyangia bacterium]|nr:glutathione transferase [Polyangia bacterium]